MRIINRQRKKIELNDYIKRHAVDSDYDEMISEPFTLIENGDIKIIYDHLDWDFSSLKNGLQKIQYTTGKRLRGLKSSSRIFGYRPRNTIRNDFCSSTSLAHDYPNQHALICSYAKKIEDVYFNNNEKKFVEHKKISEDVKNEWRIDNSIFTSGIVNKDNQLKYHFDTGNFKDVFSAMLVFKKDISGGHLSLPEFNLGVELKDNSIFLFDGQGIAHGVTSIKKKNKEAYRFSLVYYSLKDMWNCLTIDDELIRIRKRKTEREKIRHDMPKDHRDALLKRHGKQ